MLVRICRKGNLSIHCWYRYKLIWPLCKTEWKFPKSSRIELPYVPAILLLDKFTKERKTVSKEMSVCHVHCGTIHSSQDVGTTFCSQMNG